MVPDEDSWVSVNSEVRAALPRTEFHCSHHLHGVDKYRFHCCHWGVLSCSPWAVDRLTFQLAPRMEGILVYSRDLSSPQSVSLSLLRKLQRTVCLGFDNPETMFRNHIHSCGFSPPIYFCWYGGTSCTKCKRNLCIICLIFSSFFSFIEISVRIYFRETASFLLLVEIAGAHRHLLRTDYVPG